MNNKFMIGRYGMDRFSKFLIILGLLNMIFEWSRLIGILLIGVAILRIMSKDFDKRKSEEMKYIQLVGTIKYRWGGMKYRLSKRFYNGYFGKMKRKLNKRANDRKKYVIVKCPECGQKLRLPRGKGNLKVTCKMCKHQFRKRT